MTRKRAAAGFMLVELVVVMMLLGILVLLAFKYLGGTTDDVRRAKATVEIKEISDACQEYCSRNGTYPRQFSDLVAGGFYPGPVKSPYGTTYTLDGNYVFCPLPSDGSGTSGKKSDGLTKLYNPVFLYDEFDDLAKSKTIWTATSNLGNLDYAGVEGNENTPGTFVTANSTVLTSINPMPAGDFKVRAVIPSQKYNASTKKWTRMAGSVSFRIGTTVTMEWKNATSSAYAIVKAGSKSYGKHFAPDMNVHELRAKVIPSRINNKYSRVLYYIDGRCMDPTGETVEFKGGFMELTLSDGTYIGNAEAAITER